MEDSIAPQHQGEIEHQVDEAVVLEDGPHEVPGGEAVIDAEQAGDDQEDDAPDQGQFEHVDGVREGRQPQGRDQVFITEDTAETQAEGHGRETATHANHPQGRKPAAGEPGGQQNQRPLTEIAEHHAEHEHETHRQHRGGIDLAVAGDAVLPYQGGKRRQQRVAGGHRGDPGALLRTGITALDEKGTPQCLMQLLFDHRHLCRGYPAGNQGQVAAAADGGVEPDEGFGQHQAVLCPQQTLAKARGGSFELELHLSALLLQPLTALAEIGPHPSRFAGQLGRDRQGLKAGGVQHRFDRAFVLAMGADDHHMDVRPCFQKAVQQMLGQLHRTLELMQVLLRHAADVEIQKTGGAAQLAEVDIEIGEILQRQFLLPDQALLFGQSMPGLLAGRAVLPGAAQPGVGVDEFRQSHHGDRLESGRRQGDELADLIEPGTRLLIVFAIPLAGRDEGEFVVPGGGLHWPGIGMEATQLGQGQRDLRQVLGKDQQP